MSRDTGFGRKAKRVAKLRRMAEMFPDRADELEAKALQFEDELRSSGHCVKCGRLLKDLAQREKGIGRECERKDESE